MMYLLIQAKHFFFYYIYYIVSNNKMVIFYIPYLTLHSLSASLKPWQTEISDDR